MGFNIQQVRPVQSTQLMQATPAAQSATGESSQPSQPSQQSQGPHPAYNWIDIPSGYWEPSQGYGRTIQVHITQTASYQPIPPAPIVGRQPVPPGRYQYTWRLWGTDRSNPFNFINRASWEAYQTQNPHTLELRDDARSEVVRLNADRDTMFMDIQSLFALSDYATPNGVTGFGGRAFGYGPPAAQRRLRLLGFENIQHLGIPIPYPPLRQGITWLKQNVMTGPMDQLPTPPGVLGDRAPYPALRTRPTIGDDYRFLDDDDDLPVTNRYSLRNYLVRQLQNIFNVRSFRDLPLHTTAFITTRKALVVNRGGAAREFFMRLPTVESEDPGSESDGSDPGLPGGGPEPELSGELQARYNQLLKGFHNAPNAN
ncbi:hypothetical protein BKA65DRAFT_555162 [Rhexocercosporidium sp. MPI-PUGE-AT-0058]|nr:hypothetical protein BKA65DRAFT_555162 [Rhexocercosporidium sp. MPI-PUGE-AT-0058]